MGRTGTLVTIQSIMQMMNEEGKLDIFNFVLDMRRRRNYMVQTEVHCKREGQTVGGREREGGGREGGREEGEGGMEGGRKERGWDGGRREGGEGRKKKEGGGREVGEMKE